MKVVFVINDHSHFILDKGSTSGDDIMLLYFNGYDLNNITDAKKFAHNSVELKQQFNGKYR